MESKAPDRGFESQSQESGFGAGSGLERASPLIGNQEDESSVHGRVSISHVPSLVSAFTHLSAD